MKPTEVFRRLCREAEAAYGRTLSTPDLEPSCIAILQLVEEHSSRRAEFVQCFLELLMPSPPGPWEIAEFCMHQLRWPEVLAAVRAQRDVAIASDDWRSIAVLNKVIGSFDDGWEGADRFPFYSGEKGA